MPHTHVAIGWFEIPVTDMERAIAFYNAVFDCALERHQLGPVDMAWFPFHHASGKGAAGALMHYPAAYQPSSNGPLIYFTSPSGDIQNEIPRIEPAGGKIVVPRKQISPEYGWMMLFMDTEGNRIALHSRS